MLAEIIADYIQRIIDKYNEIKHGAVCASEWQTLCIIKGTLKSKRQIRYDCDERKWIFEDHEAAIHYVLKFTNRGHFSCDYLVENNHVDPTKAPAITAMPEYVEIVEPWLQGQLNGDFFRRLVEERPTTLIFPGAIDNISIKASIERIT